MGPVYLFVHPTTIEPQVRGETVTVTNFSRNHDDVRVAVFDPTNPRDPYTETPPFEYGRNYPLGGRSVGGGGGDTTHVSKVYYLERFNEQYLLLSIAFFIFGGVFLLGALILGARWNQDDDTNRTCFASTIVMLFYIAGMIVLGIRQMVKSYLRSRNSSKRVLNTHQIVDN